MKQGTKKAKQPWPTKDAMQQIYKEKLWGNGSTKFYSGEGSHSPKIVDSYLNAVTSFLTSFKNPITVVDLGCGDFNIGKQLVEYAKRYVAIDIVPELIAYNKEKFKANNLEFHCLDIATADLPYGDCALLRQVLQHLSNAEIQSIAPRLSNFKYVILTEHLPKHNFVPNKDIISGQGTRIKKQSGVNLLAPPFNLTVKKETLLSSIVLNDNKGLIETKLYTM